MPGARWTRAAVRALLLLTPPAQLLPETRIRVSLTAEEGTRGQRATLRCAALLCALGSCSLTKACVQTLLWDAVAGCAA